MKTWNTIIVFNLIKQEKQYYLENALKHTVQLKFQFWLDNQKESIWNGKAISKESHQCMFNLKNNNQNFYSRRFLIFGLDKSNGLLHTYSQFSGGFIIGTNKI